MLKDKTISIRITLSKEEINKLYRILELRYGDTSDYSIGLLLADIREAAERDPDYRFGFKEKIMALLVIIGIGTTKLTQNLIIREIKWYLAGYVG